MRGQETEAKFFVNDLQKIEMRLLKLKAHLIQERVHEINLRFDTSDGDLRREHKVLRLRMDTEARFTFKGPSRERAGGILSRKEVEFSVGSFDSAKEFLELLGFQQVVYYEKFRATYEFQNAQVMLDELPYGNFVEIESEDINAIRNAVHLLGLKWEAIINAGYHTLFERVADKYKLNPAQLSFAAFDSLTINRRDLNIIPADELEKQQGDAL